LRALRATLDPAAYGQEPSPRQRAPHLTQEQVARLAGITANAYQYVESGQRAPGPRTVQGLIDGLRLNAVQQAHLRRLLHPPFDRPHIRMSLTEIEHLADLSPIPVIAFDAAWNVLAANRPFTVRTPELAPGANVISWFFSPEVKKMIEHWEAGAQRLVGRLRALHSHYADPSSIDAVITRLKIGSADFARMWDAGAHVAVDEPIMSYTLHDPIRGTYPVTLLMLQPAAEPDPGLRLAYDVSTPAPPREAPHPRPP